MKTFVFASDLHEDHQNHAAVDALLTFCEHYQPEVKIFGGDLFDFRAIRRNASKAEQNDSMAADVEAGMDFLRSFVLTYFYEATMMREFGMWLGSQKTDWSETLLRRA